MKNNTLFASAKRSIAVMAAGLLLITACHKDHTDTTLALTGISPNEGSEGTAVTISGNNFSSTVSANTVKFNGVEATITSATINSLTVTVPSGATTGKVSVTVGSATVTSETNFTVHPLAPAITTVLPDHGEVNTTVEITGARFTNASEVYFGSVKATEVTFGSATTLTVKVPAAAVTGKIKVTANGLETVSNNDFVVGPGLTSFLPTHGERGSTVTVTGNYLLANTEVFFNNVAIPSADYVVREAGRIQFKIPANANSGKIKIRQAGVDYELNGDYTVTDIWVLKNDNGWSGELRFATVCFILNNKIYVGLGASDGSQQATFYNNFKIYDPATNTWSTGMTIPAAMETRGFGTALVANGKVYMGTGQNRFGDRLKDWWEYDPSGNGTWRQMTNYPFESTLAIAFNLPGKSYVGLGSASSDFYEFDPAGNSNNGNWILAGNGGTRRHFSACFVIGNEVYEGGGILSSSGANNNSCIKYTVSGTSLSGTSIASLPGNATTAAAAACYSKGYLLGDNGNLYEYTPSSNTWVTKTKIPTSTFYPRAVALNNRLYVLPSENGSVYEYTPSY